MKTILAVVMLMVAGGSAWAATFNPGSGVGSMSQAEVCAAMGWTAAQYNASMSLGPSLATYERYTLTVEYVNAQGATVTQTQTRDVWSTRRVPSVKAGANYNFPGYASAPYLSTLTRMGRVPQVGDGNLASLGPGQFFPGNGGLMPLQGGGNAVTGGKIINVTLSTQTNRLILNNVQVYP